MPEKGTSHSEKRRGRTTKLMRSESQDSSEKYGLPEIFNRFITARRSEGISEGTLDTYKRAYARLCEFLGGKDIKDLNVDLARQFVIWLLTERVQFDGSKFKSEDSKKVGLSERTAHIYLRNLRIMFSFAEEESLVASNPFAQVKNVKYTEPEITVLSIEELRLLLGAPDKRKYADFRDFVLMTLLIDAMLRIDEATTLREQDVDFHAHTVTVRAEISKTRKARIVPIRAQTVKLLSELIRENADFEDSNFVFLSNYGERLSTNHFRKRLRMYADKVGITKRVYPHLFRHTGATIFLESGGDIRHLQKILGHSDLRMVQRYTHLSAKSLASQHERYSPMNSIDAKLNKSRKIKR